MAGWLVNRMLSININANETLNFYSPINYLNTMYQQNIKINSRSWTSHSGYIPLHR